MNYEIFCMSQVVKKLFVFILSLFVACNIYSKIDSVPYNTSWNIRASFSIQGLYNDNYAYNNFGFDGIYDAAPHVALDFDYRINDFSVGAYLGYTSCANDTDPICASDHVMNYGMNVRYHLPRLPKWFDVYLLGKLGGMHVFLPKFYTDMIPEGELVGLPISLNNRLEAGAGLGMGFYFTKHFGMFTEFAAGSFLKSHYNWRVGFLVKI